MTEKQIYNLKTDENFKQLIPPLTSIEQKQLEENIVKDGCREPLCVWGNTIIDGHNRYEICTRLKIPFAIQKLCFNNREEVIVWICANQLGRRNISEETRRYLIGKRYETGKMLHIRNPLGNNQHTEKEVYGKICRKPQIQEYQCLTAKDLGNEYRVAERTIRQYGNFVRTIDALVEKEPELVPEILGGKVKISYNNISKLTEQPSEIVKNVKNQLSNEHENFVSYSKVRKTISGKKKKVTVKDMPAYDPDAEISSLMLTIPSWISSINRVLSTADFNKVSENAKTKLQNELKNLEYTVEAMLLAVEEK